MTGVGGSDPVAGTEARAATTFFPGNGGRFACRESCGPVRNATEGPGTQAGPLRGCFESLVRVSKPRLRVSELVEASSGSSYDPCVEGGHGPLRGNVGERYEKCG